MYLMRHFLVLAALSLTAPAWGQTALLRERDPSPGGPAGQRITFIGHPAVNQQGGYACSYTTFGPNGTRDEYRGSFTAGPGSLLREETTIGNVEQTQLTSEFGINASMLGYGALATDTVSGTTLLDSLWIDDTLFVIEGDAVPGPAGMAGGFWTYMRNPNMTDSGEIYFHGGITYTQGGSTQNSGLFFGPSLTPLYISRATYPNLPRPLSPLAVNRFQFSANGTHHLAELDLAGTLPASSRAVALDGSGLVLGGALVRAGELIPPSIGGIGDAWRFFSDFAITESGRYAFSGNTDAPFSMDSVLVRDGVIWAREGDMLGGQLLVGPILDVSMNELGNIAFLCRVDAGPGVGYDALFYEDELILYEGAAVDWNGDGAIDPNATIRSINSVVLANDGSIYFTAEIELSGQDLEGFFVIPNDEIGTNYCAAAVNSTGATGVMLATGSGLAGMNVLTLQALSLPISQFAFFLVSRTTDFVTHPGGSSGNLCLGGSIGRYVGPGQSQLTHAAGSAYLVVDLTSTPQPNGFVAIQSGETWNFQLWHRDVTPSGGSTSNFTDGYSILFE